MANKQETSFFDRIIKGFYKNKRSPLYLEKEISNFEAKCHRDTKTVYSVSNIYNLFGKIQIMEKYTNAIDKIIKNYDKNDLYTSRRSYKERVVYSTLRDQCVDIIKTVDTNRDIKHRGMRYNICTLYVELYDHVIDIKPEYQKMYNKMQKIKNEKIKEFFDIQFILMDYALVYFTSEFKLTDFLDSFSNELETDVTGKHGVTVAEYDLFAKMPAVYMFLNSFRYIIYMRNTREMDSLLNTFVSSEDGFESIRSEEAGIISVVILIGVAVFIGIPAIIGLLKWLVYVSGTLLVDIKGYFKQEADTLFYNINQLEDRYRNTTDKKEKARLKKIIDKQRKSLEKLDKLHGKVTDRRSERYMNEETSNSEKEMKDDMEKSRNPGQGDGSGDGGQNRRDGGGGSRDGGDADDTDDDDGDILLAF